MYGRIEMAGAHSMIYAALNGDKTRRSTNLRKLMGGLERCKGEN
jgi:hypothetical protein